MVLFPQITKTPGKLGPQGEEAVINVAYFKIKCTMLVERRDEVVPYFILFIFMLRVLSVCVSVVLVGVFLLNMVELLPYLLGSCLVS